MSNDWCKRAVNGLLLDITGVLYEGGEEIAIKGSVEAINRIRSAGIKLRFVTNETQRTNISLATKLKRLGFDLDVSEIFAPAPAVRQMLVKQKLRPYLLVYPNVLPEFEGIDQTDPNCVVIGDAAQHFTFESVNKAFQLLISLENPILISMGKGKYYKEGKELVLDLGAYTAALEYACDIGSIIMGKPSKEYFSAAIESMNLSPEEVVMIGDDINGDVGGAQKSNMRGVLVRSGKFRTSDENHPLVKPDAIVDNLSSAVDQILAVRNGSN